MFRSLLSVVIFGLVSYISAPASAQSDWALSAAPSKELFLRRGMARVTTLGHYAYIDGGEVSQLGADGTPIKNRASNAGNSVNSTLSIDLSTSWSSSNVTIRIIDKPTTGMDGQAMWKNEGMNAFYIWGGHLPYGGKIDRPKSWKFEADGKGGGEWLTESPANPSFFGELKRCEEGAYVSTGDTAFWFGGIASGWTNSNPASQPVPGIISYNMTTKVWSNDTTPNFSAFSAYGTIVGGGAVYIPTFGSNGLIVVMGGVTFTLDPSQKTPNGWMDFSNLTFYDPITKNWYWQKATGTPPTARRGFCYVGAEGKNGTYEIFVFGGTNTDSGSTFDDVFVLSLPGFVWTQVPYESKNTRRYHTCTVVGRRQMLSVGGTDGKTAWSGADPWPNGLGLFDMTDWEWKTDYDAEAKDYETANTIRDWGLSSIVWSSETVQNLFTSTATSNGSSTGDRDNKASDSSLDEGSQKTLSTAVIAGAVVGAILGCALVAAAFWFLRKRKRDQAAAAEEFKDEPGNRTYYQAVPPGELHSEPTRTELYGGSTPKHELWAELPKPETAEMQAQHVTVTELDARPDHNDHLLRR
ncbi:Kelch repeat-containing protein [Colletotrichum siamense]|nr:Kelch repeat-containing protein [Colletotrichum siamense]